ncbi:DNA-directed RNA polymerase specialized sigma24 family protein [Catalinimonas alkaloidigena]|uniref:RNA polymerase sigma factor n=1 Tax=Catalinimonas alkaloidigena TaxID=1075417 RepID=UPI002407285D|nr:sigma factor [Catalinimonas alkaloidigena]MDF9799631.1 DNA-directed RNA polymerase specialized sigma24 family protein [Catalinimonas alkaloidigena]
MINYDYPEQSGEVREQLFLALYQKAFPLVAQYISKRGGAFEEAKDVFQDALVIYYEKVLTAQDTHVQHEQVYILGIAKHLWLKKFRKEQPSTTLDHTDADIMVEEAAEQPSSTKLLRFLESSGRKCMDMLRAFYYDKLPLADIAQRFGYSGIRSATVQKYKCIEKVRDTVKEKSLRYEDFLE